MPKVRLRKGEEPVEVGDKLLLMGVSHLKDIPPGAEVEIRVLPQLRGIIGALLVDKATAAAFELTDLRVGANSQFVSTDPMPLAPFAGEVEGFPNMGELALADEPFRELFDLDRAEVSMEVRFFVRNTSEEKLPFRAAALYHVAPDE